MPGSREEDFKKNNAFSLYDLYGHALAQEPLPLEVEKKIFKEIMHFHNMTYMATP